MKKKSPIFIIAIILFILIIAILLINYSNKQEEGALIGLSYKEVLEKIENKDSFILVISQSTCSHCADYKPKLKNVAKEYNINIYYIDYDTESESDQNEFLNDFNLSGSTPTTIFIKNGTETSVMDRVEGDLSESKIVSKFTKMGFISE